MPNFKRDTHKQFQYRGKAIRGKGFTNQYPRRDLGTHHFGNVCTMVHVHVVRFLKWIDKLPFVYIICIELSTYRSLASTIDLLEAKRGWSSRC